jgi:hypothetical protein
MGTGQGASSVMGRRRRGRRGRRGRRRRRKEEKRALTCEWKIRPDITMALQMFPSRRPTT